MSEVLSRWYKLTINGSEVSNDFKRRVTDITLDLKESGSSTLQVSFIDNDKSFFQSKYMTQEAKVSFKCAWYDSRTVCASFVGYIAVIDVDFDDLVKVTITCMDESFKMDKEMKTRSWSKVKASDVAKKIFKAYGFTAHVDDSNYVEDSISQSNQTDASLMNSLVSKVTHKNFIWYVNGKHAYFVERKMPKALSAKLYYREGNNQIQSFTPRLSKNKLRVRKSASNVSASTGKTNTTLFKKDPSEW